ncbi:helix-turn-helix transcriptional regulator [Flagellimonas sp. S174]|uniref:helix-turn-helix transcriptional regulator n=1 Tax=Flagellimonas sp. S174 TaxID=3410790 RepID=UPI003BF5930F
MNIINLPDIILDDNNTKENSVFFYYHIGHQEFFKSKISFRQHCIAFLLSGKKRVLHQDQELVYDNSSFLLFKRGNYVSNEIATDGNPYHSILLFFDDAALRKFRFRHQDLVFKNQVDFPKGDIALPKTSYIKNYLESLKQLLFSERFSDTMNHLKFEEVMLHLSELYGWDFIEFFISDLAPSRDSSFRKIIEANVRRNTSIEELAFLCHMSQSTFKRYFRKIYNATPGTWLQERRLDYAAYLLKVKGRAASEIFEDVGYSSLSSFMHSFKRKFGVTPRHYQTHNTD